MQGILQQERVVELGSAYCTTICSAPECRIGGRKCREYCSSKQLWTTSKLPEYGGFLLPGGTCKLEVPSQNQQIQIQTQIQMEIQIQIRKNPVARREGLKCLYQSTSIKKYELSSSFSIPSFQLLFFFFAFCPQWFELWLVQILLNIFHKLNTAQTSAVKW